MATRYDILPEAQRRLLPALSPLRDLGIVLYGGTAVALHLGHRISIDFDFFTDRTLNRDAIQDAIPFLKTAVTLQDDKNTWTVQTNPPDDSRPVKLSFFSALRFGRVGCPMLGDGGDLLIASLDDLLGHKLKVLLQRVETKDYRDIAAMLDHGQTLERGLGASMALFQNFPLSEALKALVYFDDGDLMSLRDAERRTLIAHADRFADRFTATKPLPILSKRLDL